MGTYEKIASMNDLYIGELILSKSGPFIYQGKRYIFNRIKIPEKPDLETLGSIVLAGMEEVRHSTLVEGIHPERVVVKTWYSVGAILTRVE